MPKAEAAAKKPTSKASNGKNTRVVWSRGSQAALVEMMIEAQEPYTPDALASSLRERGFYANSTGRTFSAEQVSSKARQLARRSGGKLRRPYSARIQAADIDAMIKRKLDAGPSL